MKTTLALLCLLSFSCFAQSNINGTQSRLSKMTCSGAYFFTATAYEAASNEISESCTNISNTPEDFISCEYKIMRKHGKVLPKATFKLVANEATEEDEEETFTLTIINKGAALFSESAVGSMGRVTQSERFLEFEASESSETFFDVQTALLKEHDTKTQGLTLLQESMDGDSSAYAFIDGCSLEWAE